MKTQPSNAARRALCTALGATLALSAGTYAAAANTQGPIADPAARSLAATPLSPQTQQRLRMELRELVANMVESGEFGALPVDQIALTLDEPSQRITNLGVLVDSADSNRLRTGLHVLAVTPGSAAEDIGVRAGDVVLGINGKSLQDLGHDNNGALAPRVLRQQINALDEGQQARLDVRRGQQTLALSGAVPSLLLPAMRFSIGEGVQLASTTDSRDVAAVDSTGCGRISVFDVAPRQQQLHAAALINIDGRLAGTTGQTVYRVAAGTHVLEVSEHIDNRYLVINDRLRNAGATYKSLRITVEPDTTYFVAARLNEDKATQWKDGGFWDPVVWKETPETCR